MDNDQQPLSLVKDIADLLESVAAGPLHTPALYSTFLRALINAKMNPPPKSDPDTAVDDATALNDDEATSAQDHGLPETSVNEKATPLDSFSSLADFQFSSEMGPVADLSTFPPTMMTAQSGSLDDPGSMMSMDNILSNGFWDSMLVPGLFLPSLVSH